MVFAVGELFQQSLNRDYFNYLIQTAIANADDNFPETLKEQWIEMETRKFTENIIHDTYKEYANVIPVKESIVATSPELHVTISNSKLKDI